MIWAQGYDVSGISQDLVESIGQHFLHNYTDPYPLLPDNVVLYDNYPNPFNPITQIGYELPEESDIRIMIYDIMGRRIRTLVDMKQKVGYWSIHWNGTNDTGSPVPAGIYLYKIQVGKLSQTKKMVLLE